MKTFNKLLRTCSGLSLIELSLSAGLLGIAGYTINSVYKNYSKGSTKLKNKTQSSLIRSSVVEQVFAEVKGFQINYATGKAVQGDLPYYWSDNGKIGDSENDCKGCKGRYGVQLRPVPKHPGLVYVDIQLSHPTWKTGDKIFTRVMSL